MSVHIINKKNAKFVVVWHQAAVISRDAEPVKISVEYFCRYPRTASQ